MKKYKILGYLFLVLVFTIFIPATNYQVFAKTTTKTTIHKATTLKNVKKSKVKKTKKVKTKKTKKTVSVTKTPITTNTTAPVYSLSVVATHNSANDCWTTINGNVYNVTSWINQHPGGRQAILSLCGTDGTQAFNNQHGGQSRPEAELVSFLIGTLQ